MRNIVQSDEDLHNICVGQVVTLVHDPNQAYIVTDTRGIFTENEEVPNPVTLVTTDKTGRPHIITISAYCLVYG